MNPSTKSKFPYFHGGDLITLGNPWYFNHLYFCIFCNIYIPIEPKHYLFVGSWWKHRVLRGLEWKHRLFIQLLWNPYFSRRKPVFIRRKPVKKWWVIWQKPSFLTEPVFFSETSCFLTGLLFSAVFGSLGTRQYIHNKSSDSSIPYHHPQTSTKHHFLCFVRYQN